jgi:hypothetical protein
MPFVFVSEIGDYISCQVGKECIIDIINAVTLKSEITVNVESPLHFIGFSPSYPFFLVQT